MRNRAQVQALVDGQFAALRQAAPTENPFPLNTLPSRMWARGWREMAARKSQV